MSIVTTLPAIQSSSLAQRRSQAAVLGGSVAALLTPVSLVILGYHPYAEDGGLYLAGVKYLLNPSLFPQMRQFVTAPLQYSAFAACTAFLVRHSGLSFDQTVFGMFLVCLWATVLAVWRIAEVCFVSSHERIGATLLVALWMSLPVAGTSLMIIDPYLTARSLSTPLVLSAVASALHAVAAQKAEEIRSQIRHLAWTALLLALAAVFHPLMAGYGAAFILAALVLESPRPRSKALKAICLMASGLSLAATIEAFYPAPSVAFTRVALTRTYWFLAQWQWFEVLGLVAPLAILIAALIRPRSIRGFQPLARAAVTVGLTAVAISLCFAHSQRVFGVSHLQPLRVFQLIYFTLLIGLGAGLARIVLRTIWWRWAAAVLCLSVPVMIPGWFVFPHSAHIERPMANSSDTMANRWMEAFRWIQRNTPVDALFAVDANYISDPNEDAQSFRAIAERSVLADYSKDGGEAAVNPALSDDWAHGVEAQQSLSTESDADRYSKLRGLGVTWIVLSSGARTLMQCPHDNGTVKVCKLSASSSGSL